MILKKWNRFSDKIMRNRESWQLAGTF